MSVNLILGYARVSTDVQKIDLQITALKAAGCHKIYEDLGRSGKDFNREGLEGVLSVLSPGDTLVVWRLDRLGRSLSGLVQLIDELGRRGIHFRSLTENIDTQSSGGRLMFHIMAALAEFERAMISERTRAGLQEARARGRLLGRPRVLTLEKSHQIMMMILNGESSTAKIASEFRVSTRTIQRQKKIAAQESMRL